MLQGKLAIHEMFSEDSLVSYWEKFGPLAFDNTRKAMLTTCKLKVFKNGYTPPSSTTASSTAGDDTPTRYIDCCFSFTIRRDSYNM
jgi:hypothetical protein